MDEFTEQIGRMARRFVQAMGTNFFWTSDNPACFHECYGFANPESEFTFPFSSHLALFANWQPYGGPHRIWFDHRILREINRRTIKEATRFIFSPRRADWIDTVAQKREPYISLLRWKTARRSAVT